MGCEPFVRARAGAVAVEHETVIGNGLSCTDRATVPSHLTTGRRPTLCACTARPPPQQQLDFFLPAAPVAPFRYEHGHDMGNGGSHCAGTTEQRSTKAALLGVDQSVIALQLHRRTFRLGRSPRPLVPRLLIDDAKICRKRWPHSVLAPHVSGHSHGQSSTRVLWRIAIK